MKNTEGGTVKRSDYDGKVLVLVFGSWSCPSFRQRAEGIETLRARHGGRASFLVVYTKEAHPEGGWEVERNKDEGVSVSQPTDEAGRTELAKKAKGALKLNVTVAVDTMDDQTAAAYGGFPNGAVVVGRDGKVVAVQKWFDPTGLPRHIRAAAAMEAEKDAGSGRAGEAEEEAAAGAGAAKE